MQQTAKPRLRQLAVVSLAAFLAVFPQIALAAVYGGGGIQQGISAAAGIGGISSDTSLVSIILNVIAYVLDIILLVAVVALIVAGIYLIVSNGDEGNKDKAKKIILYVIIGIIIILFARLIVSFVNHLFSGNSGGLFR